MRDGDNFLFPKWYKSVSYTRALQLTFNWINFLEKKWERSAERRLIKVWVLIARSVWLLNTKKNFIDVSHFGHHDERWLVRTEQKYNKNSKIPSLEKKCLYAQKSTLALSVFISNFEIYVKEMLFLEGQNSGRPVREFDLLLPGRNVCKSERQRERKKSSLIKFFTSELSGRESESEREPLRSCFAVTARASRSILNNFAGARYYIPEMQIIRNGRVSPVINWTVTWEWYEIRSSAFWLSLVSRLFRPFDARSNQETKFGRRDFPTGNDETSVISVSRDKSMRVARLSKRVSTFIGIAEEYFEFGFDRIGEFPVRGLSIFRVKT